jgi:hypothetical protein
MLTFWNENTGMKTFIHRQNFVDSKLTVNHLPGTLVVVFSTSTTQSSLAMLLAPIKKEKKADEDWGTLYLALLNNELVHIEDGAYELVSNA